MRTIWIWKITWRGGVAADHALAVDIDGAMQIAQRMARSRQVSAMMLDGVVCVGNVVVTQPAYDALLAM